MRLFSLFLVLSTIGLLSISFGDSSWRALDLPSGGLGEIEDEAVPLAVIDLCGLKLEGEAFHLCFSAYVQSNPCPFEMICDEIGRVVGQLSSRTYFSLGAYHCYSLPWLDSAQPATPSTKAQAQEWLGGVSTMAIQHLSEAVVSSIERANALNVAHQRIVCIANGLPNDASTALDGMVAANELGWPIDVIYVAGGVAGADWWQQVATQFEGHFLNVE